MAASAGVKLTGESPSAEESAFAFWFYYHKPRWLSPTLRKLFDENIPIEHLTEIRKVPKPEFLKAIIMTFKKSPA
jgi:hypothetical protein